MRAKRWAALLLLVFAMPGCYLAHVARGHWDLLRAREPLERVLDDDATPAELRDRLLLAQSARDYAAELGLTVEGQYAHYAPWPGDYVVTTLVATRPGEVEPAGFWFPIVGRVPYKGYFDSQRARAEAERLRSEGFDVCTTPVRAYSTLGWLADPITGPMLRQQPGALVETIVHELVHANVYAAGHADFNEGVASFVGQEARVRFADVHEGVPAAALERGRVRDARRIGAELERSRGEVAALYEETKPGPERNAARRELEGKARRRLAQMPLESLDAAEYAQRARLGDACLALSGTYSSDSTGYAGVLDALDGDLPAFVRHAREAADASEPRAALLSGATPLAEE